MKVGNQPLPVSARVSDSRSLPRAGLGVAESKPAAAADRVEISPEAAEALAAARLGRATGLTGEQIRDLVARSNREASGTAGRVDLRKILALLR